MPVPTPPPFVMYNQAVVPDLPGYIASDDFPALEDERGLTPLGALYKHKSRRNPDNTPIWTPLGAPCYFIHRREWDGRLHRLNRRLASAQRSRFSGPINGDYPFSLEPIEELGEWSGTGDTYLVRINVRGRADNDGVAPNSTLREGTTVEIRMRDEERTFVGSVVSVRELAVASCVKQTDGSDSVVLSDLRGHF